ncbi:2'-5'-oligoadenylate synthase-like protein 1, partial [Galemys pyrenaicus]
SLESFVEQRLQPREDWKEQVQDAWQRVFRFLWDCFQDELLRSRVRVVKIVKVVMPTAKTTMSDGDQGHLLWLCSTLIRVPLASPLSSKLQASGKVKLNLAVPPRGGSNGKGTTLNRTSDVDLVLFLSCFSSFQNQALLRNVIISFIKLKLSQCSKKLAYNITIAHHREGKRAPRSLSFQVQAKKDSEVIKVDVLSAFNRHFVKSRPVKLKNLLRLVKHWYLQVENFNLDEGFIAVMKLLRQYEAICIYWTKYYDFRNEVVRTFIKEQLKESRPVILDPVDPTNNLEKARGWDLVAEEAAYCLEQVCCRSEDPTEGWHVQPARDILVTVKQRGEEAYTLSVNPYQPIWKMKVEIKKKYDLSGRQCLSFQEPGEERQLLSSRKTLADYRIFSKVYIWVLDTFPPEIQVFVKESSGLSKPYAIQPDDTIRDLKCKIEEAGGPLADNQTLKLPGRKVWNNSILSDLQIKDCDTIMMFIREDHYLQARSSCVHTLQTEMALPPELYEIPATRLDSFVAQWLQPCREWKKEVLEAVWMVEKFLREGCFQGERGLDQEVRVLKVVKVGSFGNGTVLNDVAEVELVAFMSCFQSFQEQAKHCQAVLRLLRREAWRCQDLLDLGLQDLRVVQGALICTIQNWRTAEPIMVTIVPAYRALGPSVPNSQLHPEIYNSLLEAGGYPGQVSPSFSELQRNFVKHRPTKLKSLLRLVKHWYLQYVRARSPRAELPPLYALELLTIYAWETGTQEDENFRLDRGLATVMELLLEYKFLCIYWTKFYTLQNPDIGDFVRNQLKKERPIILDPVDPTHNVAEGYRWDIVAQRASQCLKKDCCYDGEEPVPSWDVREARDIQVTVEQWGYSDLVLWVNPYDPIKKLKDKIRRVWGSFNQKLFFQEPSGKRQFLNTQCSLADYGIFSDTCICLLENIPPEIQVFVKNPNGESHAYVLHHNSLILSLKQQIEEKQGLLKKQQQLEFRGQVLQDWLVFRNYGIQNNDILILSKKMAGEAPFPPS